MNGSLKERVSLMPTWLKWVTGIIVFPVVLVLLVALFKRLLTGGGKLADARADAAESRADARDARTDRKDQRFEDRRDRKKFKACKKGCRGVRPRSKRRKCRRDCRLKFASDLSAAEDDAE